MKETTKTSRTTAYLEKIFRTCNEHYFNNELIEPIITIQSTPKAYGHVTVNKVWKRKNENTYELNIGAGTLNRPIENVVSTMLHEMVHIYNLQKGIQDTSRGGSYHNKKFKDKAESVDLKISYHDKYGWTITEPTVKLLEFILEKNWSDILINREEGYNPFSGITTKPGDGNTKVIPPAPGKTSSTRKYQCKNCGMSVRATKDLTGKLLCTDCNQIMIQV